MTMSFTFVVTFPSRIISVAQFMATPALSVLLLHHPKIDMHFWYTYMSRRHGSKDDVENYQRLLRLFQMTSVDLAWSDFESINAVSILSPFSF